MVPRGGYVRLYRMLLQSPIWTQLRPAVFKVAMYFLMKANYKQREWYDGSQQVAIPAGSFITSYGTTATECNLSVQQTRDAFAHLERTQFATYRRTPRWTLVTVMDWATYQTTAGEENTEENTYTNRQGTPDKEKKNRGTNTCASPGGNTRRSAPSGNHPGATDGDVPFPSNRGPRGTSEGLTAEQDVWFSQWWPAYWRHKAKKPAREAFAKHVRTEARFQEIMAATRAQTPEMLAKHEKHRPHGATWLNGERWEDETEEAMPRPARAASDEYPELPSDYEKGRRV
jgi:hypothetical protein